MARSLRDFPDNYTKVSNYFSKLINHEKDKQKCYIRKYFDEILLRIDLEQLIDTK